MRSNIVPGTIFPDYQLPDHMGTPRRLSELQGDDPLILTLSRGHYCPKEHQQHLELAAFYPKIAVGYTQIVTISTDEHHTLQEFRASVGAEWTFLSDPDRTVQKDLDIAEYTDPEHNPMIPHTLVLKPGLIIHSIYNGYWFWGRPSVTDLWHDLRAAMSEIRPDWDLSAPGLREAGTPATSPPSMDGTSIQKQFLRRAKRTCSSQTLRKAAAAPPFWGRLLGSDFDCLRLLQASERERIPLPRIRPGLIDRKAGIIQQGRE